MKIFFYILALVIVAFGVVCAVQVDQEAFRFGILLGMLCNIYAEVTD